jgi:hypothetical protein
MLLSQMRLARTADPVDGPTPASRSAAPSLDASSTEVLITTQQVLFSTAAAAGVRRDNIGARLVAIMRGMFATSTDASPHPRSRYYPKRYSFLEDAAMARAMERL